MLRLFSRLLIIFSLGLPLFGQVTTLTDKSQMSSERIRLDLKNHDLGTVKGDLFGRWGVQLKTSDDSNFRIESFTVGIVGVEVRFLQNTSSDAATSVVVDFNYPVKQAAFVLRGESTTTASLKAFGPLGNQLGTVQSTGLNKAGGKFLGLQTSHSGGVSKVVIDYGSAEDEEEIVEIYYKSLSEKSFVTYLSQLGDGGIPGFGALQTIIIAANLSNTTATGELHILGDSGEPLEFEFTNGETFSSTQFSLDPFSSKVWSTTGTSSPVAGYAKIVSRVPMEGTAVFQVVDLAGTPLYEAGVGSAAGRYQAVGGVTVNQDLNVDSGVAYVNVGDSETDLLLVLYSEDGTPVDSRTIDDIPPGGHGAAFLTGLFPLLDESFDGTLLIVADEPIAAAILRTINGLVLSSLPVGSVQQ